MALSRVSFPARNQNSPRGSHTARWAHERMATRRHIADIASWRNLLHLRAAPLDAIMVVTSAATSALSNTRVA